MSIETLFVVVVPLYLVLVAYGQVGARKRGLSPRMRLIVGGLRVVLPPAALVAALYSTGDPYWLHAWGLVTLGMLAFGALTAILVEFLAPRFGA